MPLQCWIRGKDFANDFELPISMKVSVGGLKNAIKAVHKELEDLSPDSLKLYKIPDNETGVQEILGALGSGQVLQGNDLLGKIFDDIPFSRTPRVIVELSDQSKQNQHGVDFYSPSLTEISKLVPSNDDPITTTRAAFLASAPRGCPREYEEAIPTTLLHPVFGQFVHNSRNAEVTAEDIRFAERLATAMSTSYDSESERVEAVDKVFQSYNVHFAISQTKTMGYVADAHINFKEHRYVIAEFKNEIGNASAEPYFQAMGCYLEATRESALKFNRSPLPCLLLAICGWCSHPLPVPQRANFSFL